MLHRFYSYCYNYESKRDLPVSSHLSSLGLQYRLPQSSQISTFISPFGFPAFEINFIELEGKWGSWKTVQPKDEVIQNFKIYTPLKVYIPFNSLLLEFRFRLPTEGENRYLPLSICGWAQCPGSAIPPSPSVGVENVSPSYSLHSLGTKFLGRSHYWKTPWDTNQSLMSTNSRLWRWERYSI